MYINLSLILLIFSVFENFSRKPQSSFFAVIRLTNVMKSNKVLNFSLNNGDTFFNDKLRYFNFLDWYYLHITVILQG